MLYLDFVAHNTRAEKIKAFVLKHSICIQLVQYNPNNQLFGEGLQSLYYAEECPKKESLE